MHAEKAFSANVVATVYLLVHGIASFLTITKRLQRLLRQNGLATSQIPPSYCTDVLYLCPPSTVVHIVGRRAASFILDGFGANDDLAGLKSILWMRFEVERKDYYCNVLLMR
ncbi:hypothetical protein N7449_004571 [Penicillium cf. viridicatum]|uniref:Uncharacterized protein n=1 Tax=Penicillium cf. viridicatum TaxID=2972119 RepID=A0A9W9MJU8_9EURO|nr:hypothetical protein N7449_004571 [Penicillium cf. viridicatum]